MKAWINRFFKLNREIESELENVSMVQLIRVLDQLNWRHSDEYWSPGFQVDRYCRDDDELFVIQETYFSPKLTGSDRHTSEIERVCATMEIK